MQTAIACTFMRGGTSRGPYFMADDLPGDVATRDAVLLSVMGSPGQRQIDGIGGNTTLTSKVAIISRSDHDWADVDYLFAQVAVGQAVVDTKPSCGNMLSGVGPYAIDKGLVAADNGVTTVRIRNVNTGALIESRVQTPNGIVNFDGDARIDGVDGTAAPVDLQMREIAGAVTGKLLPTGNVVDEVDGVEVTFYDAAMPMVIAKASDFGKTGYESEAEIEADTLFMDRMLRIRQEMATRVGMGDISDSVVPKFGLVAPPREGGTLASRYFTPWAVHAAYAVTGSLCIACASTLPGSVVHQVSRHDSDTPNRCAIEHPSGMIDVSMDVTINAPGAESLMEVHSAGVLRTTRKIMDGVVYVPESVWSGTG